LIRVGENCFFGIKSAVVPHTTVGDDDVVMAGALVPDPVNLGGSA
jgi:carbonic anhydrase/acetyltransferase-like protein (isoleucine patch superfamily)